MQSYPASELKGLKGLKGLKELKRRKPPLHRPTSFHTSLSALLDRFWGPMLGLCWEFFRAFFALKMRYYLEVVFSSIFDRFWTPSNPQKLSSRYSGNHILHFYTSYLKIVLGSILEPKWLSKSSPRGSKIPSETILKFE